LAFLTCLRKSLAALSARGLFTARLFIKTIDRACQRGGGQRGVGRRGNAQSALTFQPSNHSFIHAFEMQRRIGPASVA
jgi:hypothetical protein